MWQEKSHYSFCYMLFVAIYKMLSTSEQWNPGNLYEIDILVVLVEKQKAKAIKQVKNLLQQELIPS